MVGQKVCTSKQNETQQTRLGYMGQTNKRMQDHTPLDQNVSMKETEKVNNYMPLVSELQQLSYGYKYEIIPIVVGTLGAVPKSLKRHYENIGLSGNMIDIIRRMQLAALTGTVKTVKTVLRMKKQKRSMKRYVLA